MVTQRKRFPVLTHVGQLERYVTRSWLSIPLFALVFAPLIMILALVADPATTTSAASGGNLWLTGHDADFHCTFQSFQCNYLKVAINFVRGGSTKPVLVLDHRGEVATAVAKAYPGSAPPLTVVDPRAGFAGVALQDGSGSPLFSAIVVASDTTCGGCDNNAFSSTPDSDAINARAAAIASFFNAGGGILALAGANNRSVYYQFIPIPATGVAVSPPFTLTPLGLSLGLIEGTGGTSDDNCCPTHNSFALPAAGSPLQVAETDSKGFAETLIARGAVICGGSLCAGSGSPAPTPGPAVGCIQGKVVFKDTGAPAGGLQVRLTDTPLSTTTDSGGNFHFAGVNVGGGYGGGPTYGVAVTPPSGFTMMGAPRVMVTITAMGHCDPVTLYLVKGAAGASGNPAQAAAATAQPTASAPASTPTPASVGAVAAATLPQKLPVTGGGYGATADLGGALACVLLIAGLGALGARRYSARGQERS
jgi:hypothetical protein